MNNFQCAMDKGVIEKRDAAALEKLCDVRNGLFQKKKRIKQKKIVVSSILILFIILILVSSNFLITFFTQKQNIIADSNLNSNIVIKYTGYNLSSEQLKKLITVKNNFELTLLLLASVDNKSANINMREKKFKLTLVLLSDPYEMNF